MSIPVFAVVFALKMFSNTFLHRLSFQQRTATIVSLIDTNTPASTAVPTAYATMSAIKEDPDGGTNEPVAKRIRTEGVRRHRYTVAKQRIVEDPEEHDGFTHEKLVELLTKAVRIWDKLSPIYCNNQKHQFIRHHLHEIYTGRFAAGSVTTLHRCFELHSSAQGFKYVDQKDTVAALKDIFETVFPKNRVYVQKALSAGQGVLSDIFAKVRDSILVDASS